MERSDYLSERSERTIYSIMSNRVRARRFQLTINEVEKYEELKSYLKSFNSFRYIISCKETAPETGHVHIHIYVCYNQLVYLYLNKVCGAHVEVCKGSNDSNVDYIKKEGDIIEEEGTQPHQGKLHTVQELQAMMDPSQLLSHELKAWDNARNLNQRCFMKDIYKPNIKVYYVHGDSGSGKTKWVHDKIIELDLDGKFDRVKYSNNFWNGVSKDGLSIAAWYDDFRDSSMPVQEFINFIDYYSNQMNVKGSNVLNRYLYIFITSVQDIEDIYKNVTGEPRQQWMRRIEQIEI